MIRNHIELMIISIPDTVRKSVLANELSTRCVFTETFPLVLHTSIVEARNMYLDPRGAKLSFAKSF